MTTPTRRMTEVCGFSLTEGKTCEPNNFQHSCLNFYTAAGQPFLKWLYLAMFVLTTQTKLQPVVFANLLQ